MLFPSSPSSDFFDRISPRGMTGRQGCTRPYTTLTLPPLCLRGFYVRTTENPAMDSLLSLREREKERGERELSFNSDSLLGEYWGLYNKSRMISFVISCKLKTIIRKETFEGKWITKDRRVSCVFLISCFSFFFFCESNDIENENKIH